MPSRPHDPFERAVRRQLLAHALLDVLSRGLDLRELVALIVSVADLAGIARPDYEDVADALGIDRTTHACDRRRIVLELIAAAERLGAA